MLCHDSRVSHCARYYTNTRENKCGLMHTLKKSILHIILRHMRSYRNKNKKRITGNIIK